ncbi:MAG: electron transport complex subunit RsxC, partial [Clostridia bacterium]
MEKNVFPKKPFRSHGGAKVKHCKSTAHTETYVLQPPNEVILPMSQHIGAPCEPIVSVGEHVYKGQKIAESSAFVSAPIHASISGTIKKITTIKMPNGTPVNAIVIESDGKNEFLPSIAPPSVKTREELVDAIKESGCVGLGGAGFPTFIKLKYDGEKADTLVINAAECEPYITSDHREIIENSWEIMSGLYAFIELFGFKRVIIGVEENKPDAIEILKKIAENTTYDPKNKVKILKLKTRYPQGAEKMLIYACTGRVVPVGKLPLDIGCVVMNITTLSFLAKYLKTGIPLISKRMTVDGSAVGKPQNVIVPLGTPIQTVLEVCDAKNYKKILMGGPMMGTAVGDVSLPVIKQNNAILAFLESEATLPEETDCISCGRCVLSCPMKLEPVRILRAAKNKEYDELERLSVNNCIECGCCTYNCPAKRYITQQMRVAKMVFRESKHN